MILIDQQKAFDTINHKILLEKLLPIGFSKNTISWYVPYLAESGFKILKNFSSIHLKVQILEKAKRNQFYLVSNVI